MTKTTKAPAIETRFVIGANEAQAADTYFRAGQTKGQAFLAFYNAAIKPHGIDLALVRAPMAERKAGNGMGQAMYDYVKGLFWHQLVGAEWAAKILDKNVKGDTLLEFSGVVSASGNPIKAQMKKPFTESAGNKPFKAFLDLIEAAQKGEDLDKVKRKASAPKSDKQALLDNIGKAISTADKKEKGDGTIPLPAADMFKTILGAVENTKLVEMESDKARLIATGVKNLIAAFAKLDDANAVKLSKALGDVLGQFTK
jgi:hypothetical protein